MKARVIDYDTDELVKIIDTDDSYYPDVFPFIGMKYVFNNGNKLTSAWKVLTIEQHIGVPTILMIYVAKEDVSTFKAPWDYKKKEEKK